jgi:hypothetical protein
MSDDLLKFKLDLLQVASCTCGTKTPEAKYHTDSCRYRLICEIHNDVDALRHQLADATRKLEEARKDAPRLLSHDEVRDIYSLWMHVREMPYGLYVRLRNAERAIEQGKGGGSSPNLEIGNPETKG